MNVHISETTRVTPKHSDANYVSFDIFDTFVVRGCTTPDGVIAQAFQLSPVAARFPAAAASYVEHRRQAEARARKAAIRRDGRAEVGIAEIYAAFPFRLFGLRRDALPQLVAAELAAEHELCRCNPDILAQYRELRAAGARTGFISDSYWSVEQLGSLLRACCPDLQWDFLYSSSASGTGKAERLFEIYLAEQSADPRRAVHVGDNPNADIDGARRFDITALHVPQASARLASIFNRETPVGALLCQSPVGTLDGGARTLRRLVAARVPAQSPAFGLGVGVLGPAMQAFDAFIASRIGQIGNAGGELRVAFLGRDGFLSHRIRAQAGDTQARYLEISRRVSVMASAATLDPLTRLVGTISSLDAAAFSAITRHRSTKVAAFFARQPHGRSTGAELAKALPELIDARDIAAIAASLRAELMTYLRAQFPDLDRCTDLVLVDLGYSGSIQKSLRRVFDLEGIAARIHGLYLLSLDDDFAECDERDTFEGMISDLVVTPHVKRLLLRNVAVLEQLCCAPTGSVAGYRDGAVLHEAILHVDPQQAVAREVQAGVLAYAAEAGALAPKLGFAPAAPDRIAADVTAILGRLLLLPTDDELMLLGALQHDVNLGTTALTPLLDGALLAAREVTQSLPDACTAADPPMWLAGSFAALEPAQSYLYLLFGCNLLPSDLFGDVKCGQIDVVLQDRKGVASTVAVACYRNGFNEIRVRIPMSRGMAIRTIQVPVARLAPAGLITGPFLQSGPSINMAAGSGEIRLLDRCDAEQDGLAWHGPHYAATRDDAVLTIAIPTLTDAVAMLSIGVTPANGARVLALD
ncbi:HAD family hydrolase [Rhodopseudomonas sp. NSM]|uniref:HAD family hydrolase n=1 Tax=Rhodopseudomonas sp. NSM TaxID=3457630 RepID=UPI004036D8DC